MASCIGGLFGHGFGTWRSAESREDPPKEPGGVKGDLFSVSDTGSGALLMAKPEVKKITTTDGCIAFADTLINWIKKKKLEAPAALFLEMHRPLMPLAHPAAIMFGTFVAPFFGPDYYDKIEALRDPAILDKVLDRLTDRKGSESNETPEKDTHR